MKLSDAVEGLKDEWLAFRIMKDAKDPEGEIVLHDKDRGKFRERLSKEQIRGVYVTFTGDVLAEGYSALFLCD